MAEEKEKKDLYTWEDSSESIFKDFEPYHCGTPAITDAFFDFEFDPEKCNETNNFQKFERNGYTNEVTTSKTVNGINYHYSANGQVIHGCEKGTVILANHPKHDAFICKGDYNATICVYVNEYNHKTLSIVNNDTKGSPIRSLNEEYFKSSNKAFPKRLGILLVGSGGGAGGGTWYDNKKDGTHNDTSYYSGGSGGGGGVIWGVIDLEKTPTVSIKTTPKKEWLEYWFANHPDIKTDKPIADFTDEELNDQLASINSIYEEGPGLGGWNATTDGLTHNRPKKGWNGSLGYSTILYYNDKKIAWADGGRGGAAGHWTNTASGGEGGGSSYNAEYFTYCGKIDGASGISTKKDMDDAYTQKRLNKIQFLQDTSNDERFTYKTEEILARKSYVTIDTSARIPGGPSFGAGAYDNVKATKGGGGCSNGANGSNDGAKGYWIIFYA